MKKLFAIAAALGMLLSSVPVFAEETADTPADIDAAAYTYLTGENKHLYDKNNDGIISDAELAEVNYLFLDLTGVEDLSWLPRLKKCHQLNLDNGTLTDISVIAEMPALNVLFLNKVPITDISFISKMNLQDCYLTDMPQITAAQRAEQIRIEDVSVIAGTETRISYTPNGLATVTLTVKDSETAQFLGKGAVSVGNYERIYGLKPGETEYTVSIDDTEFQSKKITVTEAPAAYAPDLKPEGSVTEASADYSHYYCTPDPDTGSAGSVALVDGNLYVFNGSEVSLAETDVEQYETVSLRNEEGHYVDADIVLKRDGTWLANGVPAADETIMEIRGAYAVGKSGTLYMLLPGTDSVSAVKLAEHAKSFIPGCSALYLADDGTVCYYNQAGLTGKAVVGTTKLRNPKFTEALSGSVYYVVDENDDLYQLDYVRSSVSYRVTKVAGQVTDLKCVPDETGILSLQYTTADGTVYPLEMMTFSAFGINSHWKALDLDCCSFYVHQMQSELVSEDDAIILCYIDKNRELRFRFQSEAAGLTGVRMGLCSTYDAKTKSGLLWFLREDGTIWHYNLVTKEWNEAAVSTEPAQRVWGDVNGDGSATAADAVLLSKYLAGEETALADWKNGDLDRNGILTAADLTKLKRLLMRNK